MTFPTSLHVLEFDRVLALVSMEAKSAPGKDAVARRRPLSPVEASQTAQGTPAEMVRFSPAEGLLPLAGLAALGPLFNREPVLELDESWLVVRAARATQAMREALVRSDGYIRLSAI